MHLSSILCSGTYTAGAGQMNDLSTYIFYHRPDQPFYLVQATLAKFGLHAGNMKFNTQNEECVSIHIPYILESNAHPNLIRTQFLATS
jgi:hypothetical protein